MPLTRHRCVEVAAPYMLRVNKFVQISRADDIRSYCELFHYSLLLITLNEAKQTPQSLCDSSPFRGAKIYSITILNLPINKTNLPKAYIRQVGCLYSPSAGGFDFQYPRFISTSLIISSPAI